MKQLGCIFAMTRLRKIIQFLLLNTYYKNKQEKISLFWTLIPTYTLKFRSILCKTGTNEISEDQRQMITINTEEF